MLTWDGLIKECAITGVGELIKLLSARFCQGSIASQSPPWQKNATKSIIISFPFYLIIENLKIRICKKMIKNIWILESLWYNIFVFKRFLWFENIEE